MLPFSIQAWLTAIVICTMMALRAVQKKSLSPSGALVGWVCGVLIVASTGYRGLLLFYFYQIGSWCTKYNLHVKSQHDGTLVQNANRGIVQVLCVSFIATMLSLYHAMVLGMEQPIVYHVYPHHTSITLAIIAHHATGLADTMASELGILVDKRQTTTFLITTGKAVPPGTNGGITIMGCIWSCIGGLLIGILTILTDCFLSSAHVSSMVPNYAIPVILYSTIIGLIGSLLDSLIGATCQATYYDPIAQKVYHANSSNKPKTAQHLTGSDVLTNEQVNLISTALACILGGWIIGPIIVR
jgi:uncharacterized protein (TIGR00297 family)